MNITLWIVAILLAFAFGMAGITKLSQPKEKLAPKMALGQRLFGQRRQGRRPGRTPRAPWA